MSAFQLLVSIGLLLIIALCIILWKQSVKIIIKINEIKTLPDIKNNDVTMSELKQEVISTVLLKLFTIRNCVHKQTTTIHAKAIEFSPQQLGIEENLLNQSFSKQQLKTIHLYFQLYQEYIQRYWMNKNGMYKTVFPGHFEQRSGDVGQMIIASEALLLKLDKLLEEIQKELGS